MATDLYTITCATFKNCFRKLFNAPTANSFENVKVCNKEMFCAQVEWIKPGLNNPIHFQFKTYQTLVKGITAYISKGNRDLPYKITYARSLVATE